MLVFSDGYSKLEARGKDSQKLVFCKKKIFDLVFPFFSQNHRVSKKKKRSSLRIEQLVFSTFRSNLIMISKKHLQQNETICGIFKGGPRQLPHSPRPISTTARIRDHRKLPVNFSLTCQTKSLRMSLVTRVS